MKIEGRRLILTPYEAWAANVAGLGGPGDDDDGDGISNYAEFIFGGNPLDPADRGRGIAATPTRHDSAEAISVTFPQHKALDPSIYRIETSTNLLSDIWTYPPTLSFPPVDSDHPDFNLVSNLVPILGNPMYLRLRVNDE